MSFLGRFLTIFTKTHRLKALFKPMVQKGKEPPSKSLAALRGTTCTYFFILCG